jgi:hypothetical protein
LVSLINRGTPESTLAAELFYVKKTYVAERSIAWMFIARIAVMQALL